MQPNAFLVRLEKRENISKLLSIFSPVIALGLTILTGAILFAALGFDPMRALYVYFIEPLTEVWSLHELAIKAAPLILIATGLSLCFRSGNWNIGAEGQFIMGGVAGSALPILMPGFDGFWVLPAMLIMGVLGGMAWAFIPAYLKTRFAANEILTSLMLVYIAQLFLDWIVRGPWRNPDGFNFPESRGFTEWQILPEIFESGRTHYGALFAIIGVFAIWFLLAKTMKGFEIEVVGQAQRAGRFAGFDPKRTAIFVFLVSGAFAGLAGISEVSGAIQQLRPSISPGYGFTAIIVAFVGRLNPLGILAAGFILALSFLGGEAAQVSLQISDKLANVFQGLLLFFVLACDTLIHHRVRFGRVIEKNKMSQQSGELA
ncbi:MAG: ABC transporter permease [Pseudomonadota bacterium]